MGLPVFTVHCRYGIGLRFFTLSALWPIVVRNILIGVLLFTAGMPAWADVTPALHDSFAGNINFVGTEATRRTQSNSGNRCAVLGATTANSATLSGLPSGATVLAAYLYWAGSGNTADYDVTFDGNTVSAATDRRYISTDWGAGFFSGVADVTSIVAAKGNGSYSFSNLTVATGDPWCSWSIVMAGWSMLVIYSHASEPFRVVNVYEGFQYYQNNSISLTLSNFKTPSPLGSATGKHGHITWEGDPDLTGGGENLTFNGVTLSDGNNPVGNQFNSISNITSPVDTASYGVDFDAYTLNSTQLTAGMTSANAVYSSGNDMVLLSAEIIAVPNVATADLAADLNHVGTLTQGQAAVYTLDITNNGPSTEPGPITTTVTLPSALTYSSASGSGWACSVAGQTVTCTYTGSLASGAAAATLTLNVNVSASASGSITTSATVAGTTFDNDSSNNTATDIYVFTPTPYAYYPLDESTWGSGVIDSSGNGHNGTSSGSAAPTGYPVTTPPSSAIPGSPGTCGSGNFPSSGSPYVDTGIQIRSSTVGNAGTIAFWYRSNTAWNDGTDRMLFDASVDRGSNGADKHFYLAKGGSGRVRFELEDSGDNNISARASASDASVSFAAGTWHHIAVTWDLPADQTYLYIDGVLSGSNTSNNGSTLGDYLNTLYIGAQRSSGVGGTGGDYTSNTANGYIDEFRIYSGALSAAQVNALMTASHSCTGAVNHYELSLASTGVSCAATTATVTACADGSSPCTSPVTSISGSTAVLSASAGTLSPTTVTFNAAGTASSTYSHTAAANGATATVTLSGESTAASSSRKCCADGASCSTANSCSITWNTAGFIFSTASGGASATIPTQTAGVGSGTYYLRAVKTNTTTQACDAALSGTTAVDFAYECVNPATCYAANLMSVNGDTSGVAASTVISRNNSGSVSSYTSVPNVAFNGNGEAPFTFNYTDVGSVRLHARKAASGSLLTTLTGSTNTFVVKPYAFTFSNIKCTTVDSTQCAPGALPSGGNPAAADGTGASFIQAGRPFSATVTSVALGGTATPSYGMESAAEGIALSRVLVAPSGGASGTLAGTVALPGGSFSTGSATVTDLAWNEVGIITLSAAVADGDYLGAGNVTSTSGNVGRFIPDHFALTLPTVTASCTSATPYTYFGEDGFTTAFTLTTQSVGNTTTTNYAGTFAKLATATYANYAFSAATLPGGGALASSATAPSGTWTSGVASITAKHQVSRPSALAAPTTLTISAQPLDSDSVTIPSAQALGSAQLRYGRLRLANAFGAEQLPLAVTALTEYYNGTGWVLNGDDSCTRLQTLGGPAAALPLVGSGSTTPRCNVGSASCTATAGAACNANAAISSGSLGMCLTAPGAGNTGYVDFNFSSVPAYLQISGMVNNTSARGTFGIYKGNNRLIYRRERY